MNGRQMRLCLVAWSALCATSSWTFAAPETDDSALPLTRIDRLIDASHVGPPVALAGDAEFLRRLSLDLAGMPPSPEERRTFLADTAAEKRARAVDRPLESPSTPATWHRLSTCGSWSSAGSDAIRYHGLLAFFNSAYAYRAEGGKAKTTLKQAGVAWAERS